MWECTLAADNDRVPLFGHLSVARGKQGSLHNRGILVQWPMRLKLSIDRWSQLVRVTWLSRSSHNMWQCKPEQCRIRTWWRPTCHHIKHLELQNSEFWISNSEFWNSEIWILNLVFGVWLQTYHENEIQNSDFWISDSEFQIQISEFDRMAGCGCERLLVCLPTSPCNHVWYVLGCLCMCLAFSNHVAVWI